MEGASLVPKSLLAGAKGSEILSCFGNNISAELKGDPSNVFSANFHIKVDWRIQLRFEQTVSK